MRKKHPLAWSAETPEFIKTHCMQCLAGWTRAWTNPGGMVVCLLDQEPVRPTIAYCDRFDPREAGDPHQINLLPKDSMR
jgi:hypothetical protein